MATNNQPYPNHARRNFATVTDLFKKTFRLQENLGGYIFHDGLHAITGLGISVPDELRVTVFEQALGTRKAKRGLTEQFQRQSYLRETLLSYHRNYLSDRLNIQPSLYQNSSFSEAQLKTVPLDKREVIALRQVAADLEILFRRVTGKGYYDLSNESLGKLDIDTFDVTDTVHQIKNAFQKKENAAVEIDMAKAIAEQETAGAFIPSPNVPWHGPKSRPYKNAEVSLG